MCSERGLEAHENRVNSFSKRSSCSDQIGHILSSEIMHRNSTEFTGMINFFFFLTCTMDGIERQIKIKEQIKGLTENNLES